MTKKKNRFPVIMKTTGLLTGLLTLILCLLYGFFPKGWLLSLAITSGTTCYHFSMRLLVGALIPSLAKRKDLAQRRWFQPRSWEEDLYKVLQVKQWKKHVPTYDPDSFSLETNTLSQVIQNMCVSELVHETIVLFSFLPLLAAVPFGAFAVFCITSCLSAILDSIFVLVQRYNRPRLVRILKKQEIHSL